MCATSTVIDNYKLNTLDYGVIRFYPNTITSTPVVELAVPVSRQEFDALKASVEELKRMLLEAKAEDIRNNAPDCEMEEKKQFVLRLAEMFGIDMNEVFTK